MKIKGLLIKAGERTKNGRVYTRAAIKSGHFSAASKVAEKQLTGTFRSRAWYASGDPVLGVGLKDIAVVVTDLFTEKDGAELHAEVETLETPRGLNAVHANKLIEEARKGGKELGCLVLKPRGAGTVAEDGTVGDDYVLDGVDLCWEAPPNSMSFKVSPDLLEKPLEGTDE